MGPITRHAEDLLPLLEVLAGDKANAYNLRDTITIAKVTLLADLSNDRLFDTENYTISKIGQFFKYKNMQLLFGIFSLQKYV